MQVLRFATRSHIEAVFAENHELWGQPLTLDQYRDFWFSLFLTAWGSSNVRYMALTEEEDGPLLSTLKLYRLTGRLHGEPIVIAGIGAVYTLREQRTFGSASLLMSEVLDYMQKKKAALGLLYTEIGLPFYERLGFMPLPAFETTGTLPQGTPEEPRDVPGVEIREITLRDSKILVPYHLELTSSLPLSIDREAPYWEFILFKRRRFWEMAPADAGRPVTLLAKRGRRVIAAGFAIASREGLHIQEAGALPGEEESLRAILDRIWAVAVAEGASSWRGRLPSGASGIDPRLQGATRPVPTGIPMAAPLGPVTSLERLAGDPALHFLELDLI